MPYMIYLVLLVQARQVPNLLLVICNSCPMPTSFVHVCSQASLSPRLLATTQPNPKRIGTYHTFPSQIQLENTYISTIWIYLPNESDFFLL